MTAEYNTTLSMALAALGTNSFVLCLHCMAWKLPYFVSALSMTSVSGAKSSDVVARRPRNDSFVSSSVNTVNESDTQEEWDTEEFIIIEYIISLREISTN